MAISQSKALTEQFYQWEQRGRGWHVANFIVDLEPIYEPFWGHFLDGEIIDDGKRPHWLATLFAPEEQQSAIVPVRTEAPVIAFQSTEDGLLSIFRVGISKHCKPSNDRIEEVLIMLSYRKSPISFEIIGTSDCITFQWTCREQDELFVQTQLKAFFPDVHIQPSYEDAVGEAVFESLAFYTVDFGLKEEFMRPLNTSGGFGQDSYTALFGIMEHLEYRQKIVVQILFSGTHNAWSESIMTAVTDDSGKASFFYDDAMMPALAKEKVSRPLFGVTARLVALSDEGQDALTLLTYATTAIIHASTSPFNTLIPLVPRPTDPEYSAEQRLSDILMRESHRVGMLLNSRELAMLVHYPAPTLHTKKVLQTTKTTKAAPNGLINQVYSLGLNEHSGIEQLVGLSTNDRLRHIHILGATGTGKSTLLHSLMMQDAEHGEGFMCLDPHGDLIAAVLKSIPKSRINDVVLIDPSDSAYPVGFNILAANTELEKELLASDLVALFKRFSTSWGDQMHSVLANAILALLYNRKTYHLGDLRKFLIEGAFRNSILSSVTDPDIIYYWQHEFPIVKGGSIGPILTRLDAFLRPKVIRNIVCQTKGLDFAQLMDSKKIVLVKLSQGLVGAENSYLLGAFIVSKLQQTAMARQAQQSQERIPFYCYIDEFQHFVTLSMVSILSGARKYGLGLVLAHQDMAQVSKFDADIASAVLSNAATRICFRLGDTDAKRMQEGFSAFSADDLQNLQTGEAIVRVNTTDQDFNIAVIPFESEEEDYTEVVTALSRDAYSIPIEPQPVSTEPPSPIYNQQPIQRPSVEKAEVQDNKEDVREHRYLQTFIKKMAEEYGYKSGLEVGTPDGKGQVDLLLEKDGYTIAVEISVTTTAEWELHNIEKCLAAGYNQIIVCSKDAQKRRQIEQLVHDKLSKAAQGLIHIISPDNVQALLQPQQKAGPTETIIKGYRVKVQYDQNPDRKDVLQSIINAGKK